ncbi:nibrin isoform X1 [Varanus komodoensis]|uniref:nibrin isoform X1 n=1 Tax=Varanus komodoensis TaxID=61221 RepID=UPI001CF79EB7|nr:nibrin isoform X1 [Varanus komodoensis]
MWKLVPAGDPGPGEEGQIYWLLVGVEYDVGRKNCAILIQDDQSISRKHAIISVKHPQAYLSQPTSFSEVTLKDTSKYGTFVNEEKLPNGTATILKSGDRITFGVFGSKYRVEYDPLVVCSSCLTASQKSLLNKNILQLGGHVVNEWKEECTHLAMASVKVTVKTICALICGRPIVKPEYFAELIQAIQAKEQLQGPERFYPPIDEPSIKSEKLDLNVCPGRKTIFREKTFLFLTAKQYAKLSPAIKLGGGEAKLITEEAKDVASLIAADVCVVEVGATNSQPAVSELEMKLIATTTAALQRKKYRIISEAEIGLAVIFASTERYCNPQAACETDIKPATSASIVQESHFSQRSVVNETAMPAAISELSIYVADTEMNEVLGTCMEITEEKRNKESPVGDPRKLHPHDVTTIEETPAGTGTANIRETLPRLNRRPGIDQNSLSLFSTKISGHSRNRERDSQQQINTIKNYFPTATKKRERNEDGEASVSKYAKTEERPTQVFSHTQPIASLLWENNAVEGSQKGQCVLDQKTNESYIDTSRKSEIETRKNEKTAAESMSDGKSSNKKRKELDDLEDEASLELVFASRELDWKECLGSDGEESVQNAKKKRKLENKGGPSGDMETQGILQKENEQSLPALSQKQVIKQEPPESNHNKSATDSSNLPSRLLLTEFRSLIVSRPRKDDRCVAKTNHGHLNNFKKFKKVAYPGAGQLPHIIGGSDLIAHNARKNTELEEWLKQEMEEQNRYAREESLADDLFRYEPRIKRR